MEYTELNNQLVGRNQQTKKYAHNTYLCRLDSNIALRYHNTDVAIFKPNGDIVLDSGGWRTSTTKERISWALDGTEFGIYQEHGVWYIARRLGGHLVWRFQDGLTIHTSNNHVTGYAPDTPKLDKALKAKVKAYAGLCAQAIPLDQPSAGDCWYCAMVTAEGQSLGDALENTDHLNSHMEEGYVVPSLVYHALEECYNAPIAFAQAFKGTGYRGNERSFGKEAIQKAVYRYILKRKGYCL